jgi:hypothetical protein
MRRHQKGITLIGFVIVMCVLGFFAYAAMRLVPVYNMHYGVVKAMQQIQHEPGANDKSLEEIRRDLDVKFDLQFVDSAVIPPQNIQLKRLGGANTLRIFYDRQLPFIGNVDLLVHFDSSVDLSKK